MNIAKILLALFGATLVCGFAKAGEPTTDATQFPPGHPGYYLEFSSELDAKCQIRSDGGKVRMMKNTHESRAIKFRLVRYFAGKKQPSLLTGVIESGAEARRVGCTLVDYREQTWEVQKVEFAD